MSTYGSYHSSQVEAEPEKQRAASAESLAHVENARLRDNSDVKGDSSFVLPTPKPWFVALAAGCTLVSGLMCNLSVKFQSRESAEVWEGGPKKAFDQPYWQTFVMFAGEAMCIFVYMIDEYFRKRKNRAIGRLEFPSNEASFNKRPSPFWWWAGPAAVDLTGTAVINMAFTMTYASTVQMLRNSILILTSFISLIWLRRPLRRHEWCGILLMTVGMIVSGIQAIRNPESSDEADSQKAWLGIVLTLGATVFNAAQLIFEEWMLGKSYIAPMKAQGLEGLWGLLFNGIIILILHYAGAYNMKNGFHQMGVNWRINFANYWYFVFVFIFNGAGLCTTKLGSGLLRGVIYSCRAPILWVIEMIIGWADFDVANMFGLLLAFFGFFIFACIIPGVSRSRTPNLYRFIRRPVPCFCTQDLPDSDVDLNKSEDANRE